MNVDKWIEALQHPLVLVFLFAALIKPLFLNNKKLSGTAMERLLHKGMNFAFALALLAIVGGLLLSWKNSGKAGADEGKGAKPAAERSGGNQPVSVNNTGPGTVVVNPYGLTKEQYEEDRKKLLAGIVDGIRDADAKERVLLEVRLKAAYEQLADMEKNWKEELARRKAADKALDQVKGLLYNHRAVESVQPTHGSQSPVINASGNSTINYGMTKEKFTDMLREQQNILTKHLKELQSNDVQQRDIIEQRLKNIQNKLENGEKSYEEELALRKAAEETLEQLKAQLPEASIKKAQAELRQGDNEAAKQIFYAVAAKEGIAGAFAAYHLGQMAESNLDYAEALRMYKKAVALEKANPEYLFAAGELARKMAEYSQAEDWLEHLLKIREQENDELALAGALTNLALLYHDQGRYSEAEPLYERSLVIFEKKLGKDHPDVAVAINNLAELYRVQGRYKEAELLMKRSQATKEKVLGLDHPSLVLTMNNLMALYEAQGQYEKMEATAQRTLTICEKSFGMKSDCTASALHNLAGTYHHQGRYMEAEPLYNSALAIRERIFGTDHPNVAMTLTGLANLYARQGRYTEADPLYKRSLESDEKTLGKDHPSVAGILSNLAGSYFAQGRYNEAKPLYQQAIAIMKNKFPSGYPNIDSMQKSYDAMKRKMAEQK